MSDAGTYLRQTEKFDEQEYVDWVKRQLGYPTVDVEIEPDQVKDALQEALALYSKWKPRRVTESFIVAQGISSHKLTLPGARGVYHVEILGVTDGLSAPNIEAQLMSGSYTYYGVAAPKMDLRYYEYLRQWVKVASRELSSEQDYHLSDDGTTLWIYSPGRESKVTVTVTLDHVTPETVPSHDQVWLRKLVLAYCKQILGQVRSKFQTVLGANKDITLNGAALIEEGKAEAEKLEEKIEKARTYAVPSWG